MKRIAPSIECELSFSTGTFLNNYDVIDRKLKPLVTFSTVGKWKKWKKDTIVMTTISTIKLVGLTVTSPVLDPLVVLHLENWLYIDKVWQGGDKHISYTLHKICDK